MFTTNESGEILLVESKAPAIKKTRAFKKKEKEPTFVPSFFSDDYFNFLISDNGAGEGNISTTPHLLLKWKSVEYLPMYSLGIKIPNNLPIYEYRTLKTYLSTNPNVWDTIRIGKLLKEYSPTGFKYFKSLWEKRNYRLLSFFTESYASPAVEMSFKVRMKEIVDRQFKSLLSSNPDVSIHIPNGSYKMGTPRLMGKFKYHNEWRWTNIKQQSTRYNNHPMYLSNLGFIARQSAWNNMNGFGSNLSLYPIKPLACVLFKAEHYQLIKAYILANEPIPTELLQLWVDKSLHDASDTTETIRTSFIRQILNPYKKLGIEIIVKDDLSNELFNKPEKKKFRTQIEQIDWTNSILKEFTESEKIKLRIS